MCSHNALRLKLHVIYQNFRDIIIRQQEISWHQQHGVSSVLGNGYLLYREQFLYLAAYMSMKSQCTNVLCNLLLFICPLHFTRRLRPHLLPKVCT